MVYGHGQIMTLPVVADSGTLIRLTPLPAVICRIILVGVAALR